MACYPVYVRGVPRDPCWVLDYSDQPVAGGDVHGEQVGALGLVGDARRPADERVALRASGQGDDDAFARLPGAVDVVVGAGRAVV